MTQNEIFAVRALKIKKDDFKEVISSEDSQDFAQSCLKRRKFLKMLDQNILAVSSCYQHRTKLRGFFVQPVMPLMILDNLYCQ